MTSSRNATRVVRIGSIAIGGGNRIAVQSMCATHTQDVDATVDQINDLVSAGADVVRVAVDNKRDAEALAEIRQRTSANLSVDLQENYRLAKLVAPYVDKIRYNPGHLYHHEKSKPWQDKVKFIVDTAGEHDCAIRVGVNAGSVDPGKAALHAPDDSISPMLASALAHCELLDQIGFTRYAVSLKDSDPRKVIELNRRFSSLRSDVPIHLGVTEAGMPPDAITKTRVAFEPLISEGIGDTLRVSLTLPNSRKSEEIHVGRQILDDIAAGRLTPGLESATKSLNIISCPSCSRVENEAFIELAEQVKAVTQYAADRAITIAVMGCRVNGPGETDDADLGLWCGPRQVNLKRKGEQLGTYGYDEILERLKKELDSLVGERQVP